MDFFLFCFIYFLLISFQFEEHYDILQHMKERVKNLDLPKQALTISENEEVLVAFQLMLEKVQ